MQNALASETLALADVVILTSRPELCPYIPSSDAHESSPFNGRDYLEEKQHGKLDVDNADLRGATRCRGALGLVRKAWGAPLEGLTGTATQSASTLETQNALARAIETHAFRFTKCARCDDVLCRKYIVAREHSTASNVLANKAKRVPRWSTETVFVYAR